MDGPSKSGPPPDDPQADDQEFFKLLASADGLSAAIRGTLYVEAQLKAIAREAVTRPDALSRMQLDYDGWIQLALALGLNPDLIPPLRALGTIRNGMAHRVGAEITEQEAKNLYRAFSSDDAARLKRVYEGTLGASDGAKFTELSAFDRFVLMVATLRAS